MCNTKCGPRLALNFLSSGASLHDYGYHAANSAAETRPPIWRNSIRWRVEYVGLGWWFGIWVVRISAMPCTEQKCCWLCLKHRHFWSTGCRKLYIVAGISLRVTDFSRDIRAQHDHNLKIDMTWKIASSPFRSLLTWVWVPCRDTRCLNQTPLWRNPIK